MQNTTLNELELSPVVDIYQLQSAEYNVYTGSGSINRSNCNCRYLNAFSILTI